MSLRFGLGTLQRYTQALLAYRVAGHKRPAHIAVLTTSRSGSTWFCDLLARSLYSAPIPEHLRPADIEAFLDGSCDFATLLAKLECAFYRHRTLPVVGTKIIWDPMRRVEAALTPAQLFQLQELMRDRQPVLVRLQRQNRVAQAVSRYLATQSGVWHRVEAGGSPTKPPATAEGSARPGDDALSGRSPPYSFEAIERHWRALTAAENHLDSVLSRPDIDCLTVHYESLCQDPVTSLSPVLRALFPLEDSAADTRRRAEKAARKTRFLPTATGLSLEMEQRFRADCAARDNAR